MTIVPTFAGTFRSGTTTLSIEAVGEAFHLAWRQGAHAREGCGIAVGAWLYAVRSEEGAATAPAGGLAGADFDARTGVIVYEVQGTGHWPATFYHPKDAGRLTHAVSGKAPKAGLVGEFVVGYEARTGEKRDAVIKTITRDGERYRFTWAKDGVVLYEGIGLDRGPRFAAAWGAPGRDHELAILHREGDALVCTRTSLADGAVTTERFA
jgi:hypothetical protein